MPVNRYKQLRDQYEDDDDAWNGKDMRNTRKNDVRPWKWDRYIDRKRRDPKKSTERMKRKYHHHSGGMHACMHACITISKAIYHICAAYLAANNAKATYWGDGVEFYR